MGMYDTITSCKYPLPHGQDRDFQTKSLGKQLDRYEIREDGSLWHEVRTGNRAGEVEFEREPYPYTGEVRFYDGIWTVDGEDILNNDDWQGGWIEYSSYFVNGQLKELHLTKYREPEKCQNKKPK